ncbi:MAG: ADP-ribosylglycohydrolase family protein [Porphyrobacter sp.]|nr:ADP-ribosylglycohydrolase family protein [Porphyrobacter sp.]
MLQTQIDRHLARTSTSHPLQIAEVRVDAHYGSIGLTLCPGKRQSLAASGVWERDLVADMEAIRAWGAQAVVTLVEPDELEELRVSGLGAEVHRQHMAWFHLPIRDVSVPGADFEQAWMTYGARLCAMLRDGFKVLVHCKGGLGRAGTIAARLMIELGVEPERAIREVRLARPGAIETPEQEAYVKSQRTVLIPSPVISRDSQLDRAQGALLGLAVGDALGTTLEFSARDAGIRLTDMVGGGPFGLAPGQWTDDTAMALALGESLLADPFLNEYDLMERFVAWRETGAYSCTGDCFDIGITTSQALSRFRETGNPVAGSRDPRTAGNGSLMRLAPVAIRHWRYWQGPDVADGPISLLEDIAVRQSRTTHGAIEAIDACRMFAQVLAEAIAGEPRSAILQARSARDAAPAIGAIMAGRWRGKLRDQIASSGYVAHSLEAALWAVGSTGTFEEAVLAAANLGDDADTTAAITGQLAGAIYGASAIPVRWLTMLAWEPRIRTLATTLFEAGEA